MLRNQIILLKSKIHFGTIFDLQKRFSEMLQNVCIYPHIISISLNVIILHYSDVFVETKKAILACYSQLNCKLFLDFTSSFICIFFRPRIQLRTLPCIWLSHLFGLLYPETVSSLFHDLDSLMNTGQMFCKMSPSLNLLDSFFMLRLRL